MSVINVVNSLNILAKYYEQLIDLAKAKREIIIANEVTKLNILISKESDIIKNIVDADQSRIKYISEYFNLQGLIPSETTTMNDVLKVVHDPTQKKQLSAAQHKLLSLINEIKELNHFNTELIKQSLAHIDYSLNVVTGTVEQEVTYKRPNNAHTYQQETVGSKFNANI